MKNFVLSLIFIATAAFGFGFAHNDARGQDSSAVRPTVLKNKLSDRKTADVPAVQTAARKSTFPGATADVGLRPEKPSPASINIFGFTDRSAALNAKNRLNFAQTQYFTAIKPPDLAGLPERRPASFQPDNAFNGFGLSNFARGRI